MAKVFTITDGSSPISLINASGFQMLEWRPKIGSPDGDLSETLTEIITLKLNGSSQDNLASQLLAFTKLLKQAEQYHTTTWQTTPIYLHLQGENETNPRYALIRSASIPDMDTILDKVIERNNILLSIVLTVIRENWTDKVPGAYPSAETLTQAATTGPASPTRVHISNTFDEVNVPTYIFNDDGGVFNDISGSNSDPLFSDAGNIQMGDIVYFGFDDPGHVVVMDLVMSANVDMDISIEYWNGAFVTANAENGKLKAYPDTPDTMFDDNTSDSVKAFSVQASDWTTSAIDGQTAYWIKIEVEGVNTAGTVTLQNTQPYCPNVNYIHIPNTVTDGDLAPHLQLALANGQGDTTPAFSTPSRVIACLNSRDVALYQSILPAQDISPLKADWTYTLGSNASNVDNPLGFGNKAVDVTMGDNILSNRLEIAGDANNVDAAYYGKHRALLLCEQKSGADNDLNVQLQVALGGTVSLPVGHVITEQVDLQTQDAGAEVVDLGIIDIPDTEVVANDDTDNNAIIFSIWAERTTGSSTLVIYGIVLLRADEWIGVLNSPIIDSSVQSASINRYTSVEMDSGVVRKRVSRHYNSDLFTTLAGNQPVGTWELHGDFPMMLPATEYYLHCLIMRYAGAAFGTGPWIADVGAHLVAELRVADRYASVRGGN